MEQFFDYILPHEIGHIVFREFVGFNKKLPLWLDEGVAVLQEKDRHNYMFVVKNLVDKGNHRSLEELSEIKECVDISPGEFYSQSASIVEFFLQDFGKNEFISFCRSLRDEEDWREAVRKVYKFDNLHLLEKEWIKWVKRK